MTVFHFAFLALIVFASTILPARADEKPGEKAALTVVDMLKPEQKAKLHEPTGETLKLSRKLHDLWDIEGNVNKMLDERAQLYPEAQREQARKIMGAVMTPEDVRELSVQLAARIYTEDELEAMVEYFEHKEARTAEEKRELFTGLMDQGTRALVDQNASSLIDKVKN
jgi:hypothetical protein